MNSKKLKAWISAARLRTLPLSVSGIVMAAGLSFYYNVFNISVFSLSLVTTLLFQVLSNFANDYGDGVKGTDNQFRIGPKRALQSGSIGKTEMKRAIWIISLLSLVATLALIYCAFGTNTSSYAFLFLLLGVIAILAAILYTVGKAAYGYVGLGDLFVFLFFGLVSVLGGYFLYDQTTKLPGYLPAVTIGLLSVAVLNLNNMRDVENDTMAGKRTLVVWLGTYKSKLYHFLLVGIATVCFVVFINQQAEELIDYLPLFPFLFLWWHLYTVSQVEYNRDFDPELKKVALNTFAISILYVFTQWV